ncbi:MAG: hypothetical protein WDN25_16915 [Acetobacteraceae bacterium]
MITARSPRPSLRDLTLLGRLGLRGRLGLCGLALLSPLLAACQAQPTPDAAAPAVTAGLGAVPGCAEGVSATLADGVRIGYLGSDPEDPQRCLLRWSGRSYPLYFGFWSVDSQTPMSDEARAAFRAVLTGPVGTEASFQTGRARLWSRVSIAHIGNTAVEVAGRRRPAVELRVVRHDAFGRPDVRAETRYTIDRATGVMLRRASVTPMANGEVTTTTNWQVGVLQEAG